MNVHHYIIIHLNSQYIFSLKCYLVVVRIIIISIYLKYVPCCQYIYQPKPKAVRNLNKNETNFVGTTRHLYIDIGPRTISTFLLLQINALDNLDIVHFETFFIRLLKRELLTS